MFAANVQSWCPAVRCCLRTVTSCARFPGRGVGVDVALVDPLVVQPEEGDDRAAGLDRPNLVGREDYFLEPCAHLGLGVNMRRNGGNGSGRRSNPCSGDRPRGSGRVAVLGRHRGAFRGEDRGASPWPTRRCPPGAPPGRQRRRRRRGVDVTGSRSRPPDYQCRCVPHHPRQPEATRPASQHRAGGGGRKARD